MPKKPDRFERAVEKHVYADQWNIPVINASRATKLLRAEHAWMRRMVIKLKGTAHDGLMMDAYDLVLDQLTQRRTCAVHNLNSLKSLSFLQDFLFHLLAG